MAILMWEHMSIYLWLIIEDIWVFGDDEVRSDWILLIDLCDLSCIFLLSVMTLSISWENPQASLLLISWCFIPHLWAEDSKLRSIPSSFCSYLAMSGLGNGNTQRKRSLKGNGTGYLRTVGQLWSYNVCVMWVQAGEEKVAEEIFKACNDGGLTSDTKP